MAAMLGQGFGCVANFMRNGLNCDSICLDAAQGPCMLQNLGAHDVAFACGEEEMRTGMQLCTFVCVHSDDRCSPAKGV
jgi:hypothetical protein